MVENPTLSGIIIDQTSMPATCLPRYRVPQTLVRTRGLYGPALQRNHFYDMQPQEIGLTVEEG